MIKIALVAILGNCLALSLHMKPWLKNLREELLLGKRWGVAELARKYEPGFPAASQIGYDGQFYYAIAHDPLARDPAIYGKLDSPSYRYQRILLPLLARILTFGNLRYLTEALFAANLLGLLLGVTAIFFLCRMETGWKAACAIGFLIEPGLLSSLVHALPDALSLSLAVFGLFLWRSSRPRLSVFFWVAAALAKETTLLISLGTLLWEMIQARKLKKDILMRTVLLVLPVFLWHGVLRLRLGAWPFQQSYGNFNWPFFSIADFLLEGFRPLSSDHWFLFFCGYVATWLLSLLGIFVFIKRPSLWSFLWAIQAGFVFCFGPAFYVQVDPIERAGAAVFALAFICLTRLSEDPVSATASAPHEKSP